VSAGWGQGQWGASPWGGANLGALQLASAVASRENAVQLVFTKALYLSGLGDVRDGTQAKLYVITPDPLSVGRDGTAPRAVSVVSVAAVAAPGFPSGDVVELTLDRPMTPSPSTYNVAVSGLWTADLLTPLDLSAATAQFSGCHKKLAIPSLAAPTPAPRDFANPQSLVDARAASPRPALVTLGVAQVDDTGDYAYDSGLVGYKKRVLRRLLTTPGGFLHLGAGYGVGLLGYGKRLATAAARLRIAALAETQIAQEPETAAVKVTVVTSVSQPGLFTLVVLARTRSGQDAKLVVPSTAFAA
jgi:hypothetical protein